MPSSSSLVERDDSDEGYLPRGQCEMLIAGAAYAISEGVYAFPQGSTEREWGSWVERMSAVAKGAFKQVKRIAKGDKHVGVSFIPAILWNFTRLHSNYEENSAVFDLSMVLVYDRADLPKGVKAYKLRACHGDQHFVVDVAWMAECVTTWNNRRTKNGWPTLELDQTPYKGRYIMSSQEDSGTDQERSHSPPLLAPKVLLDEAQLKLLKRKREDKGKAVDRPETVSQPSDSRGRSHEPRKLSSNDKDELAAQANDPPRPLASTSSPRRSSRHRTPSRRPVPQIVSSTSGSPPPKRVRTTKNVTIDLTVEARSRSPSRSHSRSPSRPRSRSRSRSRPRSNLKPKKKLKSAIAVASTSAATLLTTDNVEALASILRDVLPSRFIMNNKSSILWKGLLLLPPEFWKHIPQDRRLDLFQQALVPCYHCAIAYFPCYRQLGVAIACIRCRSQHTQCSQTFRKDNNSIENPYAHMLARYMLSWQIHYFEHGEELIIAYRDFTDCSLMPGVPLKFMPGMRAGKSKEHEAVVAGRATQLSTLGDWETYWQGADYGVMARTWRFINSGAKGSEEVALKRTPQFGELLPENIQQDIDSYYEKLLQVDPNFHLSDSEDEDEDEDAVNDNEDQSVTDSYTTSAARVEDDLNDLVGDDDNDHEMDEFDNDDTIVIAHSGNTPLVGDVPPVAYDNAPSVNDASLPYNALVDNPLPPPVDDPLLIIDDTLPPIDDTLSPTTNIVPSIINVPAPIHVASVSIPPPADDVDDVLTPIDETPSPIDEIPPPIDVDVHPSTNDGPSAEVVDDVLLPIDDIPSPVTADVPPLVNDRPPSAAEVPIPSQENVVMHEPDQDVEVGPNSLTLSDIIVFPSSPPPPPNTATSISVAPCGSHNTNVDSSGGTVSVSTVAQPAIGDEHETQLPSTSSRLSLQQDSRPLHDLGEQIKGPLGELEVEELQRLRKTIPELTEEIDSQQRLVVSLRERLAATEHKQKQTQQQLEAVTEELQTTKVQSDVLRGQNTSAAHVALASIIERMGSLQESQTRAIHSAVLLSVDKVLHSAVQPYLNPTSSTTSTPAEGSTLPHTPFLFNLPPDQSNCRPDLNTPSHHPDYPPTAMATNPAPTSANPSTSSSTSSSSTATTHVTSPVNDVGGTLRSNENSM